MKTMLFADCLAEVYEMHYFMVVQTSSNSLKKQTLPQDSARMLSAAATC